MLFGSIISIVGRDCCEYDLNQDYITIINLFIDPNYVYSAKYTIIRNLFIKIEMKLMHYNLNKVTSNLNRSKLIIINLCKFKIPLLWNDACYSKNENNVTMDLNGCLVDHEMKQFLHLFVT